MRESMGIITDDATGLFRKKNVLQLMAAERDSASVDTPCVFVAIDPNGGGGSFFAICTGIRRKGLFRVSRWEGYSSNNTTLSLVIQSR